MRECLLEVCEYHLDCEALNVCCAAEKAGIAIDMSHQHEGNSFPGLLHAKETIAPKKPPLGDGMVVLPKHYSRFEIEPIHFIVANGLNMLEANAVKYTMRAPYKHNDKGLQDYTKAIRCLVMQAKRLRGDKDWWKPYRVPNLAALIEEEITGGDKL